MKKYLKPAAALCLVLALAIGATLAYLTDDTDTYTNSFTVGEDIEIDLTESDNEYVLVPGETVDKDPTITVKGDESYIFVEVVETIPTAALSDDTYTFADYVDYTLATGTAYSSTDDTIGTDWKWALVGVSTTNTGTYVDTDDGAADGEWTSVTYVYALVDSSNNLLAVSSDWIMAAESTDTGATAWPDVDNSYYVAAEFNILKDDSVTIPDDLTAEMLALLLTADTTDDSTTTYTVDLAFTGYAIQSANIDSDASEDTIIGVLKDAFGLVITPSSDQMN